MWVQATDGRFYKDPMVIWKDAFLQCEDDEVELVSRSEQLPNKAKLAALKEIEPLAIKLGKRETDDILWPDGYKMTLCHIWKATLLSPIPIPNQFHFAVDIPRWDDKIIGFRSDFDTTVIVDTLHGVEQDIGLIKALFGRDHYKLDMKNMRGQLSKELFKQYPWLGAVTKSNKARILNTQPARLSITWKQCS
jgi:hypothetical protein